MEYRDINYIVGDNFNKYGVVLELTKNAVNGFDILVTEKAHGWRIALYEYDRRNAERLENHPTSKESFEPVKGVTLLVVAEKDKPEEFETFLLDKPVCLEKGVWHQVITLSDRAVVKITENLEVDSEFFYPKNPLRPAILL